MPAAETPGDTLSPRVWAHGYGDDEPGGLCGIWGCLSGPKVSGCPWILLLGCPLDLTVPSGLGERGLRAPAGFVTPVGVHGAGEGFLKAWGRPAGGDGHLEVTVHHEAAVHVLQAQDDLGRIEPHLRLREDAVLGQVIVQVPPCGDSDWLSPGAGVGRGLRALGVAQGWGLTVHEVEDEAELVGRVEGIGHAHDERAVLAGDAGSPSLSLSLSPAQPPCPLTPVLTRDSMMRSLRASVSPCFILMRFLSKHFMAYLGDGHGVPAATASPEQGQHPAPAHSRDLLASPLTGVTQQCLWDPTAPQNPRWAPPIPLHFSRVRFPAAVDLPEAAAADDSVNAEIVHGELEG